MGIKSANELPSDFGVINGAPHPDTIISNAATKTERNRCLSIVARWHSPSYVRLHAGEMSAQEIRTVQGVLRAIKSEIENKA